MSNLFNKLRDFVGLNDPADYDYEYDEIDAGDDYQTLYQEENSPPPGDGGPPSPSSRLRKNLVRVVVSANGCCPTKLE